MHLPIVPGAGLGTGCHTRNNSLPEVFRGLKDANLQGSSLTSLLHSSLAMLPFSDPPPPQALACLEDLIV